MNTSIDLRGSINKKVKTLKGQKVDINDISMDLRPPNHDNPSDLKRIQASELKSNLLFKSTFDSLYNELKNSSNLKKLNLGEPKVSFVYRRDWKDSVDLVIDFFCKMGDSTQYIFFEVDMNTNGKEIAKAFNPRIYSVLCYKVVDEYPSPEYLISVANNSLISSNINGYSVVDVILARKLYVIDLLNPESFTLIVIVEDNAKNHHKAILAYTIEEDTHQVQVADFEIFQSKYERNDKIIVQKENNDKEEENLKVKNQKIMDENLKENLDKKKVKRDEMDYFVIAGECSYEILLPKLFNDSNHMIQTIDFIRKEKIYDETKFGKNLDTLLAGVSLMNNNGLISLICDFACVENENTYLINQVSLLVKKKCSESDELEFTLKKLESNYMQEMDMKNKNAPKKLDIQKAIDILIEEKKEYNHIKEYTLDEVTSIHYVNNDNLVFPEQFAVNITYMSKQNKLKKGLIFYGLHDFDKSFIPISFYEVEDDGKINYNIGKLLKDNKVNSKLNHSNFILDLKLIIESKHNENYSVVQIPPSLNYHINSYVSHFLNLLKSNLSSNKEIDIKYDSVPTITYSQLRQFNDYSHDLVSYILLILSDGNLLISEIAVKIKKLYSNNKDKCELKSIKSFVLTDLDESNYPDYGFIISLLWAHSVNHLASGIEILCVKKSNYNDASLYFTEIYYVEYHIPINYSNYSFIYGVNIGGEVIIIKPISVLSKSLALGRKLNNK